jgi:hypothetical protein
MGTLKFIALVDIKGVLIFALIGIAILILIGTLILWFLAKILGKINNANFVNTLLITFVSTLAYIVILFFIVLLKIPYNKLFIIPFNILIFATVFIIASKIIWKCKWDQSVKTNFILIGLYTFYLFYLMSTN